MRQQFLTIKKKRRSELTNNVYTQKKRYENDNEIIWNKEQAPEKVQQENRFFFRLWLLP